MKNQETQTRTNPFENKETSSSYASADPIYQKSAEAVVKFQDPKEFGDDAIVIDLGAGTGVSSTVLLQNGAANLTLVDPSRAMLEEAETKLQDRVEYICASAETFYGSFDSNVDLIYALNCIHLFENMLQAIAGIACALKQGGLFVFNISAPTYSFNEMTQEEQDLIQANLEFYKKLNDLVSNPILEHTVQLLTKTLEGDKGSLYTKDKFIEIFKSVNFEFKDSSEITINVEADYQRNIWRMIAQSFIQDSEQIEELISSTKLPETIKLRQALFKFSNLNSPV